MENCTNEKLNEFSHESYRYINQIFGDETVRQIISEVFPNKKYKFVVKPGGREYHNSSHHVLKNNRNKKIWCSGVKGYQNTNINTNDTLCQSYSLLTYLKKPIDDDQKQRQMDMIQMYREILSNPSFLKEFDIVINDERNKQLWKVDPEVNDPRKVVFIEMDTAQILKDIHDVLDKWEKYGYLYYIGDGKCPKSKSKSKPIKVEEPTRMITRSSSLIAPMTTRSSSLIAPMTTRSYRPSSMSRMKAGTKRYKSTKMSKIKRTRTRIKTRSYK